MNEEEDSGIDKTAAKSKVVKGDPRLIVTCDEIEEIVFGSRFDPEKVYGRRKNRKARAIIIKDEDWKPVDMEDTDDSSTEAESSLPDSIPSADGGVRIRPPQDQSDVNFSVGGERGKTEKIEESAEDLEKRRQGAKRAEEREMVRRAARRAIVFGLEVLRREPEVKKHTKSKGKSKKGAKQDDAGMAESPETEIRKAEALMNGMVVEPSFAKGSWSIRWRE